MVVSASAGRKGSGSEACKSRRPHAKRLQCGSPASTRESRGGHESQEYGQCCRHDHPLPLPARSAARTWAADILTLHSQRQLRLGLGAHHCQDPYPAGRVQRLEQRVGSHQHAGQERHHPGRRDALPHGVREALRCARDDQAPRRRPGCRRGGGGAEEEQVGRGQARRAQAVVQAGAAR